MKSITIESPPKLWWSGDKRVEKYMHRISDALDRNNISGNERIDIYNRAYESIYKAITDYDKNNEPR